MAPGTDSLPYRDPNYSTGDRVADLLDRMSVAEKAGQLVGVTPSLTGLTEDAVLDAVTEWGVGSVSPMPFAFEEANGPATVATFVNRVQRAALEQTRLGIPVLTPTDAVHGHAYVAETTIFPHSLGMAATRDPALVRESASATARELRATGMVQNYAPTADVCREPRWGRTFETFGESPRLCATLVSAAVAGYQQDPPEGERVAATVKHFPAYGEPVRGEDAAAVDRSASVIHRNFLPPFRAAIDAGVDSLMPCYNAIDGVPVHGSSQYLTDLLRDELGFDGLTVSDWGAVEQLHEEYRTADSHQTAVHQTRTAGLDLASIGGSDHHQALLDLVEAGSLDESRLDESVRRVLRLKVRLGLFEDPFVDPDAAGQSVGEHDALALRAARRVQTLLANEDDVLPFETNLESVFVTGPNADALDAQCGGWTVPDLADEAGTTVREGIEAVTAGETTVRYEQGTTYTEPVDIAGTREAAASADAAVVVLGEPAYIHEFVPKTLAPTGTGEFPTRTTFGLSPAQRDLLQAVQQTDTPTALVLLAGRPLPIPWAAEHVPGILFSYYPGAAGGRAVAETLFGSHNPSGRLPISIPRSAAHLPTRFNHTPTPEPVAEGTHPSSYDPLFAFGHGLSYTEFAITELSVAPSTVTEEDVVTVDVTIENIGDRAGREAIDVFVRDLVSSRVTPVREYHGVATADLTPGEQATDSVEIDVTDLGVVNPSGERIVEPGAFEVLVGDRKAAFTVTERS